MNVTADAWMVIENKLQRSLKLEAGFYYNSCDFLDETRVRYVQNSLKYSGRGRTKNKIDRFTDSQYLELELWSRKLYLTCRRFRYTVIIQYVFMVYIGRGLCGQGFADVVVKVRK